MARLIGIEALNFWMGSFSRSLWRLRRVKESSISCEGLSRNGEEHWIVAHIEIQNQKEADFGERVFVYYARLRIILSGSASFAVLGDTDVNWRPNLFTRETLGFNVQASFPIVKLVDYKKRKEELQASDNPFAVVVQLI